MKTNLCTLFLTVVLGFSGICSAGNDPQRFIVGAKIHFTHGQGPMPEILSLMKQGGLSSLIEDVYWIAVEQKKGEYQMPYEKIVDESLAAGIDPVLVLAYWNPFYNKGGSPVTDESREGFAKYCEYVAGHFKGRVHKYEIWNEWGAYSGGFSPETPLVGQSIENYVKLIKAVYPRIKAVDPDCKVMGGWMIEGYLDEVIERGGLKYLDAVSLHAYPFNAGSQRYSPEGWIKWIQLANTKLAKASPNKMVPFYITEAAWPTHVLADGTAPDKVLSYIARMYLLGRTVPQLAGIYWYDFQNDTGYMPDNQEANFGLIDLDFMPKPGWFGVRDVADLVSTGEFLGRVETNDPNAYVLKFKRKDGKDVLAVWSTTFDDFRRVVLKTSQSNPAPLQFQKVGHTPVTRAWGSLARTEGEPFIADQLFVTVGETPWLVIGDLKDVKVLPEVKVRVMPESKRPTSIQIHLPKEMAFASPVSVKPHEIYFNQEEVMSVRELDTFATVEGWGVSGSNNGPRTAIRHVSKPAVTSNGAAEMTYEFKGVKNQINNCIYAKRIELPADTHKLSFRMCGDGSGHMVWVNLIDKTGEIFAWCVAGVPGKEWTTVTLDLVNRKPDSHWDGNNDGKFDGPLSFHSLAIENNDRSKAGRGKVYLDELVVERTINPDKVGPSFTAAWDADNIYLTAKVHDETHVQHFEDAALWKGDSFQVAIQALPQEGPMPRGFTELTAALTKTGPKLYLQGSQIGEKIGLIKDARLTIDRQNNLTTYKLVLPVKSLGLPTLKPGVAMAFSLVVNKNDGQDRSYVEWGSGIANSKDPMAFNWLVLCPF
jgi:hypothetical protein